MALRAGASEGDIHALEGGLARIMFFLGSVRNDRVCCVQLVGLSDESPIPDEEDENLTTFLLQSFFGVEIRLHKSTAPLLLSRANILNGKV